MIAIDIINECISKELSFPQVIKMLSQIGIERYYTDLVAMKKTFYSYQDETYIVPMHIENLPKIATGFHETQVIEALRAIQKDEIDYNEFIRNIAAAGTTSYTVFITGKQVSYIGRKGETYIEKFP